MILINKKTWGILGVIMFSFLVFNYFKSSKHVYIKKGPDMNTARAYHQSILLDDGNVLVTGGIQSQESNPEGLSSAEIYDSKENKFKLISEMNLPHTYHSIFKMADGNIVIADVNGIEIYDKQNKTFKLLKTKPTTRYSEFKNYKFALLPNDRLLIIGGRHKINSNSFGTNLANNNSCEIIDLENKTSKTKNIADLLNEDIIIDALKYSDNSYWIQMKSYNKNNSKLFNISDLSQIKISTLLINPSRKYRSSNIKYKKGIFIIGGKLGYQEFSEYATSSEQRPYSQQQYNIESEDLITKSTSFIEIYN